MIAKAYPHFSWVILLQFSAISELTRPSGLSIARLRDGYSWGKMSAFSQSFRISLTLNTTLNYSRKFYADKSDNSDFILHGVWTGPVGKIGTSGNIKFLKIHINPTLSSMD